MRRRSSSGLIFALLLTVSCLDKYDLPVGAANSNVLVVDGYINTTAKVATVKLSRSTSLADKSAFPPEMGALVIVESDDGGKATLFETRPGIYELTNFTTPGDRRYNLYIRTMIGAEFRSEPIQLTQAPPIDSVSWKPGETGVTIYVNTHDSTGKTRYYKWSFMETWEYTSKFVSMFKLEGGAAVLRKPDEYIYRCWKSEYSTQIILGTSAQLSQDVIRERPITFHDRGAQKLSRRYRLLVQQRALTEEAYNFWNLLENTTENLGGLFDPLPARVSGNLYSVNNINEPVLGFFDGGTVQEKVIYINFADLPEYLLYNPPSTCVADSIRVNELAQLPPATLLGVSYGVPVILGYTKATAECLDCRTAGGSTTQPAFWE